MKDKILDALVPAVVFGTIGLIAVVVIFWADAQAIKREEAEKRAAYTKGYCEARGGYPINNDTCNVNGRVVTVP